MKKMFSASLFRCVGLVSILAVMGAGLSGCVVVPTPYGLAVTPVVPIPVPYVGWGWEGRYGGHRR